MDRTALTKFRLSNHELMIEKGRHQGLDENQRTCPTCKNGIEFEQHFLMSCTTYRTHREKLMVDVTEISPKFTGMDENERFVFLLNAFRFWKVRCKQSSFPLLSNSPAFLDVSVHHLTTIRMLLHHIEAAHHSFCKPLKNLKTAVNINRRKQVTQFDSQ